MVNITKDQLAVLNAGSPATTMAKSPGNEINMELKKSLLMVLRSIRSRRVDVTKS